MKVLETDLQLAIHLESVIFEGLISTHKAMFEGDFVRFDNQIKDIIQARKGLEQLHIKRQNRDRLEAIVKDLQAKGMVIDFVRRVI
ncbi:hypothetical protein [Priestia aryabhattai]